MTTFTSKSEQLDEDEAHENVHLESHVEQQPETLNHQADMEDVESSALWI
jgi:hypothetical protein